MTTSIHVDVVLTSKLWLADEHAWRVGLLNVPGSTAETLYSEGQFRIFKVERDRVFWMGARDAQPSSATLHVSLPAQLRSEEEYERERKALAAEKHQLEQERIATSRHSRRLQLTALVAALASAGITFAVTSASGRGPSKDGGGTPTGARECRQALARLQTLSVTAATAEDIKKAIQREAPACLAAMDPAP